MFCGHPKAQLARLLCSPLFAGHRANSGTISDYQSPIMGLPWSKPVLDSTQVKKYNSSYSNSYPQVLAQAARVPGQADERVLPPGAPGEVLPRQPAVGRQYLDLCPPQRCRHHRGKEGFLPAAKPSGLWEHFTVSVVTLPFIICGFVPQVRACDFLGKVTSREI